MIDSWTRAGRVFRSATSASTSSALTEMPSPSARDAVNSPSVIDPVATEVRFEN